MSWLIFLNVLFELFETNIEILADIMYLFITKFLNPLNVFKYLDKQFRIKS